jgi:hypothetical protein
VFPSAIANSSDAPQLSVGTWSICDNTFAPQRFVDWYVSVKEMKRRQDRVGLRTVRTNKTRSNETRRTTIISASIRRALLSQCILGVKSKHRLFVNRCGSRQARNQAFRAEQNFAR